MLNYLQDFDRNIVSISVTSFQPGSVIVELDIVYKDGAQVNSDFLKKLIKSGVSSGNLIFTKSGAIASSIEGRYYQSRIF